jgi:predicted transcriptional regulator of viral defense system
MTVEKWIDSRQAHGRYTFLRAESVAGSGLSVESVKKALQRSVSRGRVLKLKDYFYVVVPLEYQSAGGPPVTWFIHDLMAAMRLPYYVALLTAAAQHGASHQQPQEFQVVTDRSVRPLMAGRVKIRFFASQYVESAAVTDIKTPTGFMRVSTPETTAIDMVRFVKAAGHLDNVATVLSELAPSLDPKRLLAAVQRVDDLPNAKRLGYLLDRVDGRGLCEPMLAWVRRQSPRAVPLRPGRPLTGAPEDRRWHILVNQPIEVDA